MDTLKAVSPPPYQGSGSATAPPKHDSPITAVSTSTAPIQVKLTEQPDQEDKQKIASAVNDINNFFQMAQRSLGFSLDESSGKMVMQITDSETHEVIRQIPGEDVLQLAKHLDGLTGVLFKAQA
ncbi:MAG: flagellar protein FlaG [Methylobacter sp.]|nr:flagellar protein FlaG [Methylobacter sp.]